MERTIRPRVAETRALAGKWLKYMSRESEHKMLHYKVAVRWQQLKKFNVFGILKASGILYITEKSFNAFNSPI